MQRANPVVLSTEYGCLFCSPSAKNVISFTAWHNVLGSLLSLKPEISFICGSTGGTKSTGPSVPLLEKPSLLKSAQEWEAGHKTKETKKERRKKDQRSLKTKYQNGNIESTVCRRVGSPEYWPLFLSFALFLSLRKYPMQWCRLSLRKWNKELWMEMDLHLVPIYNNPALCTYWTPPTCIALCLCLPLCGGGGRGKISEGYTSHPARAP